MKSSSFVLTLSALLLAAAGCRQISGNLQPTGEPVRVRRVLSGQTIEIVRTRDRARLTLRLAGLDAPDLRQAPWGDRARQALEAIALDKSARADLRARDRYGRDRGYLWVDGQSVNIRLVADGHALAAEDNADPDYARLLQQAQARARLLELGIWNPTAPLRQHPRSFRAQRRNFPDNGGN